jgi:hypothetical protein
MPPQAVLDDIDQKVDAKKFEEKHSALVGAKSDVCPVCPPGSRV